MLLTIKKKIAQFFSVGEGEKGIAAIEFAIAGSLVIITILSILEILAVLFINVLIEGGVREASRFGITGDEGGTTGRETRILEIIGENTLGLIDMSSAQLTTLVYESFSEIGQSEDFTDNNNNGVYDDGESYTDHNSNGQWDADRGIPGLGEDNDIVLYVVEYDWPFLSGVLRPIVGDSLRLSAAVPVRNEPYKVE